MSNLQQLATRQMRDNVEKQDHLYDTLVIPSIETGDVSAVAENYARYQKELNGFDARAFRRTVQLLVTETKHSDPQTYKDIQEQFSSIPEYVDQQHKYGIRLAELNESDGTPADKQAMWETLDRTRTNEHNKCIDLFNHLNRVAEDNNISHPYPNHGLTYDKSNPNDRESVANVINQQEPLFETINGLMAETVDNSIQSTNDKLRTMNLGELFRYAQEKINSRLDMSNLTLGAELS